VKITEAQRRALGFAASSGGFNPHGGEWRTAEKLKAEGLIVSVKVPGQNFGVGQYAITMKGAKVLLENGRAGSVAPPSLTPAQARILSRAASGGFYPYGGPEHALGDRLRDRGLLIQEAGRAYRLTDAGRLALQSVTAVVN
jgi:predicted transcriptional regulator